ncbi:Monocarboxylate transporter 12 [Papilio machaon]|uniref:Monocarboxylate transporter 12 n=1 Tax=Papilio machaon TaxID=76193 RepID=A0A0N1IBJ3_PAPMA|nr:Monocarboxylate transporter 12 [Papilio machaon]
MSLPREFIFKKELARLEDQVLGSSAPPTSTAPLSCSIDLPATDTIVEASLSPDNAGSLLSIQSAPPEQRTMPPEQRERPASLLLELPLATQVGAYLSAMSPTEQEEDSLLTLSSVTARPLLAASRNLRPRPDSTDFYTKGGTVSAAFCIEFNFKAVVEVSDPKDRRHSKLNRYVLVLAYDFLELARLEDQVLGSSAPPTSTAPLSCSIDLPATDTIVEASLSPDNAGSLLSIQSAPPEQRTMPPEQRERPASLLLELPLATISFLLSIPCPPDGGYGWVVVFGAFMVQFWVAGLFKSYGVLYVEIMETFPDSSESVASWIPAALSTLCLALAPLSSALCEKYSCRLVVFIGGLFCATGLAMSFFSTGLLHLLLSFGVMTGIGGGLSTTPGIVIVSQYFDKHRALANGICVSGTAAGSFVFPMLIEKLVDTYGLHGTVLLLGGGMLHVCVSATLYRAPPVPRPPTPVTTTTTENTTLLHDIQEGKGDLNKDNKLVNLFQTDPEMALNQKNALLSDDKRTNLLTEIIHPSLIEVARPPLPSQLSDSEDSEGLDVLGVVGLPREVARLRLRPTRSSSILHSVEDLSTDSTCVYKASRRKLSRSLYIRPPLPSRLIQNKLAEPVIDTKKEEVRKEENTEIEVEKKHGCVDKISRHFSTGAYGLCLGCWFLLVPVLLADAFGTARIASSYGLVRMFQSLAAVSVPPTAGMVRDITGGYSWCFYGMGSCMVLGSIPVIAFHITTKNEDNESTVD